MQQVRTLWTKASRGGDGAVWRNAVPAVVRVPFPCGNTTDLVLLHHKLSFEERTDFKSPCEEIIQNPESHPLVIGCVTVDWTIEKLQVAFAWRKDCGAPDRGWMRKTMLLSVNEWGQVVYNGRFSDWDGGQWRYEKTVVNVGLFEPPSDSVFTRNEPNCRYEAMGNLL
jgi:hypothetical protein